MTDEVEVPQGISRRDMLKRSAVVGGAGALMWVAPSVTAFGPRAFGQEGTPQPGGPGEVSWVMVWFQCGDEYHLVKYEGTGSGYSQKCDATKQNVSQNDPACEDYFDVQQTKVAGLSRNNNCPDGVSVSATSTGALAITTDGTCQIVGWVLHDGSCRNVAGAHSYPACRSVENPLNLADGTPVGPTGADLPGGGPFLWEKCK